MTADGVGCGQHPPGSGGPPGGRAVAVPRRLGIAGGRRHPSKRFELLRVAAHYPKLGYNPTLPLIQHEGLKTMKDRPGDPPQRVSQVSLISPDYNFEEFCIRMIGKDYRAVIDATGAEASYALGLHRHTTKEGDFAEASSGREYRENLRRLVSLLANGSVTAWADASCGGGSRYPASSQTCRFFVF
jgi:hypothetical protein